MLGWPEKNPADLTTDVQSYHEITPSYRDNLSDIRKGKIVYGFLLINRKMWHWDFTIKKTSDSTVFISFTLADITGYFNEINQLCVAQLEQLRQTKSGKHVEILNQLVADMEYINKLIVQTTINESGDHKDRFLDDNKISEDDLFSFKFPGYNAEKLKKSVSDVIKALDSSIMRYDNDPDHGGRHIAPHNVNISTVIALNLTCDVIEGSY